MWDTLLLPLYRFVPMTDICLYVSLLQIPHRSEIVQYLTWLISLSVTPSRFIRGVANDRIPFFFKAE